MSRRTVAVVVAAVLALGVVVVVQGADLALPGNHIGYEPDQPVLFSHQVHAGDLAVPCLYCHTAAEKSRHAGIPSAELCMNCHKFVSAPLGDVRAEEEAAEKEKRAKKPVVSSEIRKIYRALALADDGKPLEGATPAPILWTRVHNLPDFAYFDHRSHVTAGVACTTCHGPVETMHRVRQFSDLSMGWCVNCHRTTPVPPTPQHPGKRTPSTDCAACHY
jgi:hypothetical protein